VLDHRIGFVVVCAQLTDPAHPLFVGKVIHRCARDVEARKGERLVNLSRRFALQIEDKNASLANGGQRMVLVRDPNVAFGDACVWTCSANDSSIGGASVGAGIATSLTT
jgi:hypothetical protein